VFSLTTIKDIAQLAEVSIATVSKIKNGNDRNISRATRDKVNRLIEENNYVPNAVAKGLKSKRTKTLGFILPDISNPFFPEIARGVEDIAWAHRFSVTFCNTDNDTQREEDALQLMQSKMVDGVIVTRSMFGKSSEILTKYNFPIVVVDRKGKTGREKVGEIVIDAKKAFFDVTEHLIACGCKNIAYISAKGKYDNERYNGFKSALIHAATMVVAGVYQVASLFPIWVEYAPNQLHWVAYIAAFTAFYAAAVACCQRDIKRGLAFSTISQIAYMLVALGVCYAIDNHEGGLGYMASMFHLFTHAMFKALLFLCSGAIIVIIGSNFKEYMGGLHKYMPITNACFLIGCIAISGVWPFAGFFSKDEIVSACFEYSPFLGWFMTLVSGMTAFYMFRLYYVIFWGQSYYELDPEHRKRPAEVPFVMWGPLVFLAIISIFAGWIPFGHFVSATGQSMEIHLQHFEFSSVAWFSLLAAAIGIGLATWMYLPKHNPVPDMLAKRMPVLHKAALNRFYIDNIWQFITHKIVFGCFSKPIAWFDRHVIDGTFNFMAWGAQEAGETIRPWQSGDVRAYASWFLTGTIALALVLLCIYC